MCDCSWMAYLSRLGTNFTKPNSLIIRRLSVDTTFTANGLIRKPTKIQTERNVNVKPTETKAKPMNEHTYEQ